MIDVSVYAALASPDAGAVVFRTLVMFAFASSRTPRSPSCGRNAGSSSGDLLHGFHIQVLLPGPNYGIDFQRRGCHRGHYGDGSWIVLRSSLNGLGLGEQALQQFGSPDNVLIRLERQPGGDEAQQKAVELVRQMLMNKFPGTELRSVEAVGATISGELFQNGMIALGLALVAMLIYIWFRFEWQFSASVRS